MSEERLVPLDPILDFLNRWEASIRVMVDRVYSADHPHSVAKRALFLARLEELQNIRVKIEAIAKDYNE